MADIVGSAPLATLVAGTLSLDPQLGFYLLQNNSGSTLASAGVRAGDIVTEVNRRPVRTLQELNEIAASSRILFLLVERGDRALMLQVR